MQRAITTRCLSRRDLSVWNRRGIWVEQMRCDQENEKPLEKTAMSELYAFRESLDSFTDDIFAEGRNQGTQEQRDNLD